MSTKIRPEVSVKNKYWISKHRYYELKHFCLQYPLWKKQYKFVEESWCKRKTSEIQNTVEWSDPVAYKAMTLSNLDYKIRLVEKAAMDTDAILSDYILKGVTEGLSFAYLKSRLEMPCERDMYYDRYRKFFWLLSERRS